jgi:hypothetical protein
MPIRAPFSACSGVPQETSARPAAAVEQAGPTSPGQPTSAPEAEAFPSNSTPTVPRGGRAPVGRSSPGACPPGIRRQKGWSPVAGVRTPVRCSA